MKKWFTAMTVAPRRTSYVEQTMFSLRAAGLEPTAYAEPDSPTLNCATFKNSRTEGIWHNWLGSARSAVMQDVDFILTIQDDVLVHPDTKDYLNNLGVPEGCYSIYTSATYQPEPRESSMWQVKTTNLHGACAIVWNPEVLRQFIEHDITLNWKGGPKRGDLGQMIYPNLRRDIKHLDSAIGQVMRAMHQPIIVFDPSIARHIGDVSSHNPHAVNKGFRNCRRCADFEIPLAEQMV